MLLNYEWCLAIREFESLLSMLRIYSNPAVILGSSKVDSI